jgi:hypothetical protein
MSGDMHEPLPLRAHARAVYPWIRRYCKWAMLVSLVLTLLGMWYALLFQWIVHAVCIVELMTMTMYVVHDGCGRKDLQDSDQTRHVLVGEIVEDWVFLIPEAPIMPMICQMDKWYSDSINCTGLRRKAIAEFGR